MVHPSQWVVTRQGSQVYLAFLAILVSHLLLMVTPLHHVAPSASPSSHGEMAEHLTHAAGSDWVQLTANGAQQGYDCAIRGSAPTRPGLTLLLKSTWSSRSGHVHLAGLMPSPAERSARPPPLPDLHVLFRVFRI